MTKFNPLNFIADHAMMNLADAIKEAYEQGKRDAQPEREKGKWILGGYEDMYYICDQCGHKETEYYSVPKANFCKVCGADMRGEQDEID